MSYIFLRFSAVDLMVFFGTFLLLFDTFWYFLVLIGNFWSFFWRNGQIRCFFLEMVK